MSLNDIVGGFGDGELILLVGEKSDTIEPREKKKLPIISSPSPKPPAKRGKYRCLVIDPPWNQGKTGRRSVRPAQTTTMDYPTMDFDAIRSLPIPQWAAEDAFVWLWATNSKERKTRTPVLRMAFDLLEEWGFNYYTTVTWNKRTGPCPFGPYQVVTEHALFGYRGKAIFSRESMGKTKTLVHETPKAHSVKPDALYDHICEWFEGPRLDVFARKKREGFDGWGNQYEG